MKIKLRTRVNDVAEVSGAEFIHYDNCSEVCVGKAVRFGHDNDGQPSPEYVQESLEGRWSQIIKNPHTGRSFDNLHSMLRSRVVTSKRIKQEIKDGKHNPGKIVYHLNTIDWKDRTTKEWHRLVFDTVAFLQNDQGDTLEKIEG